jgi:hypothetical protein
MHIRLAWSLILIIPATLEAEISGIWFRASPSKKLGRSHPINNLGVVVHACDPSYVGGFS